MAVRAQWKGFLKLGMLTCPVALYTASSKAERISLHTLNRETGHRVKREYVDEVTGKPVDREEQVKGYEVDKDEYVIVTQEEIDAAIPESTKIIEIESFVDCNQFDDVYMGNPYYLAPVGKPAQEAFAVIRDAMRKAKVVGIGRTVLFRRDRVLMLRPEHDGILIRVLRFSYEVRPAAEVFDSVPNLKISGEMLELAEHIIKTKKGSFHIEEFEDRYEEALTDLIKAKQAGRKIKAPAAPKATNVASLLDALRESAGQKPKATKAKPAARKSAAAKSKSAPRRKAI
jgi:DNA end-binding protein Ku